MAESLGVTEEQRVVFNSELDEVNAVKEMVEAEVSKLEVEELDQVPALWDHYRSDLSSETFSVLEKIAKQFRAQVQN